MFNRLKSYFSSYADITPEDAVFMKNFFEQKSFNSKTILTKEGEPEEYIYFIVKGVVKVYFMHNDREIITYINKEGEVVSAGASFFSRKPSRYFLETLEPAIVICINHANFFRFMNSGPKWQRMCRLLMTEFVLKKERWLLDDIEYSPRERFLRFFKERPDLLLRVPQKQLAAYLNIKPETFSRLKHLIRQTPPATK